jgi:nucleotide-binding universal stress UspA family protein
LAAPESTAALRSIVVPVDGSKASLQAVALAAELGRKNKGMVYVIHVIEVKRTLALDAPMVEEETAGDAVLSQAEEIARKAGFEVESEMLHAREAGPAIVDEAIERRADLIVVGVEHPQPLGEFQLPRVAQAVLRLAPCQVWICRGPAE